MEEAVLVSYCVYVKTGQAIDSGTALTGMTYDEPNLSMTFADFDLSQFPDIESDCAAVNGTISKNAETLALDFDLDFTGGYVETINFSISEAQYTKLLGLEAGKTLDLIILANNQKAVLTFTGEQIAANPIIGLTNEKILIAFTLCLNSYINALFGVTDGITIDEETGLITYTNFDISASETGYTTADGTIAIDQETMNFIFSFTLSGGQVNSISFTMTEEPFALIWDLNSGEELSIPVTVNGIAKDMIFVKPEPEA